VNWMTGYIFVGTIALCVDFVLIRLSQSDLRTRIGDFTNLNLFREISIMCILYV